VRRALAGLLSVAALSACGSGPGPVAVDPPKITAGGVAGVCDRLAAALPAKVDDLHRRRTDPVATTAAAWGNPPVVLRCGVGLPPGLTATSQLSGVNEVDWYVDEQPTQRVWTTFARAADVEVTIPDSHDPAVGPIVDLAAAIKATDPKVTPPHLQVGVSPSQSP
jgi:hypothetical protein